MRKSGKYLLVTFVLSFRLAASFVSIQYGHNSAHQQSGTEQAAYELNSAFEWLSEDRYESPGYNRIEWLDLSSIPATEKSSCLEQPSDQGLMSMPLYPLGTAYLPSTANQTLNNVEPQNLQMVKDLLSNDDQTLFSGAPPPLFCVALRALDTGRVASIGTVMRILKADEQFRDDGTTLVRIRLTCRAEGRVEICDIINPQVFGLENRLRKSSEYLLCHARKLDEQAEYNTTTEENRRELEQEIQTMVDNFNMIKTIYQLEIGKANFPPSTLFQLGLAMSTWDPAENFLSEEAFWNSAQEWQSVCYTIRQGKQAMLAINRNELMVEAASAAKGALKLPIHLEDLSPQVRREIQLMEVQAQNEYFQLGLDPCLDFQALLSLPNHRERILRLARMISKERRRLEKVATEYSQKSRA